MTVNGESGVEPVVTTSQRPRPGTLDQAQALAADHGLVFVDRRSSVGRRAYASASTAIVVTNHGIELKCGQQRFGFHLSTAEMRRRQLERTGDDPLVRAGSISAGDEVLDTTLGLGRDAFIASLAVGPSGRVVGIEASLALALLVADGIERERTGRAGRCQVEVRHDNARAVLAAADAGSYDVVLIDPMFDLPRASDPGFAAMRPLAADDALDVGWVEAARRVARRAVVVRAARPARWFDDVGLEPVRSSSAAPWFRAVATGDAASVRPVVRR